LAKPLGPGNDAGSKEGLHPLLPLIIYLPPYRYLIYNYFCQDKYDVITDAGLSVYKSFIPFKAADKLVGVNEEIIPGKMTLRMQKLFMISVFCIFGTFVRLHRDLEDFEK
jgi:hypothetical protein